MIFKSCTEIRRHCFEYLDGLGEPEALRSIRSHLSYCAACREEFDRNQAIQADLHALPRRHVPPELALRLRVRLSQELHRNALGRFLVRLENAFRPLLLPTSAGSLVAIICFGVIMSSPAGPVANVPDVPVQISTPPRVLKFAPININTGDQGVVVVTHVSSEGRVMDYKVLSGQRSREFLDRLDRIMYFSIFQPATTFGQPTDGKVVLSLRHITVRG